MPELKLTDMNQRIGIDKVQFYGFGLDRESGIDFSRLMNNECVKIEEAGNGIPCIRYLPTTHKGILKLIITDNQVFSDLVIGCTRDGRNKIFAIAQKVRVCFFYGKNMEKKRRGRGR